MEASCIGWFDRHPRIPEQFGVWASACVIEFGNLQRCKGAQTVIESAAEILLVVAADGVCQSVLGEYEWKEGGTAVALIALGAGQELEGVKDIRGVECVVSRTPDAQTKVLYGGCSIIEKTWKVYLVEYDGAGTDDLLTLADRMVALFQGSSYAVTYSMDGTAKIAGRQQVVLTIPPYSLVQGATDIGGQVANE